MKTFEKRELIEKKYKWDIESVYDSNEAWEKDFIKAESMIKEFSIYEGRLLESADMLAAALKTDDDMDRLVSRLYLYAKMKQDENSKDTFYQSMVTRAESLAARASEATAFFTPEIMDSDENTVKEYLEASEELRIYKHFFDRLYRIKPHTLSKECEEILAMTSEIASAPQSIFSMLNLADFDFGEVKDSEGKVHKLSHGSYGKLMEMPDRELRKNAFKQLYSSYSSHKNSLAAMLQSEVKSNIFYSKARKYKSARYSALFRNTIEEKVYDSLIDSVGTNLHHMHRYINVRKKAMGYSEQHMYDIYAPLAKDVEYDIPFEEAMETIIKAFEPLGKDYVDIVKASFEERWIDVYETPGKRSGAYSWGTYDTKPFIMLNYYGTLDNMFTLAHEMGHSMHSYLTRTEQPSVYGNYGIFLAEVASTTNEALLTEYLLKTEKDKGKRLYILNHYLDQFRGTLFRQTMFAEFEREIHKLVEEGGALNCDNLSEMYLELNKKYYGEGIIHDEEIKYEWSRIPHFYYNFYVFQYATGFSAAIALAKNLLSGEEEKREAYLSFLKAGSSKYPIDVLKNAGADMTKEETVNSALELFGKLVDELEKELEKAE